MKLRRFSSNSSTFCHNLSYVLAPTLLQLFATSRIENGVILSGALWVEEHTLHCVCVCVIGAWVGGSWILFLGVRIVCTCEKYNFTLVSACVCVFLLTQPRLKTLARNAHTNVPRAHVENLVFAGGDSSRALLWRSIWHPSLNKCFAFA